MDELTQPQVVQGANPGPPQSQPALWGGSQPEDMVKAAVVIAPEGGAGAGRTSQDRTAEKPFLTVRYNKQDKPLSREEAAVYAQKGMNYDKLMGRLKAAEEQIKALDGGKTTAADEAATSAGGDGTPPLQGKGAQDVKAAGDQRLPLRGSEVRDVQAVVDAQLGEFAAAHPEVDPASLPAPVISAWKRGVPLSEAYGAYRAREEQRQERARTVNAANAAASMGGAGFMGASTPQQITDDSIKAMSPKELDKNHARIWAYLTGKKA